MASQPDKWDYTLAGVPSPLTDELESQQLAKQVICCSISLRHPHCAMYWRLGHLQHHFSVLFAVTARALAAAPLCATCSHPEQLLQHVLCY